MPTHRNAQCAALLQTHNIAAPSAPCSYAIKKKDEIERVAKANR